MSSITTAMANAESASGYVVPTFLTPSRRALTERLRRDWLPDSGTTLGYTFSAGSIDDGFPNDMSREDPGHVRVMTWNVEGDTPWESPAQDARYDRMFDAIVPDIVNFQEIYNHTAGDCFIKLNAWRLDIGRDQLLNILTHYHRRYGNPRP